MPHKFRQSDSHVMNQMLTRKGKRLKPKFKNSHRKTSPNFCISQMWKDYTSNNHISQYNKIDQENFKFYPVKVSEFLS